VAKGQKVIVALNGAELPGGIKIKKGMIRGEESNRNDMLFIRNRARQQIPNRRR
jgi:hypothetical protein